jgi:serine phosphatase RsbU (regulator of sigma subunit)
MLVLVIGLLLPLPFFYRRRRLGQAKFPLLFLCAWIACAGPYLDYHPWSVTLIWALPRAGLFLFALFYLDVLTAIIAIASPPFISFVLAMAVQPAPSLHRAGLISVMSALLVLGIEIYFALRGRLFREDEVSPVYAKNLAERLSMQAEVSAAREAQVRLMPVSLPNTDYFSIAASFKPAFEVGGDFYDVFELEPGKIGILMAEGGGRGLGSALSIAYAKGFLMPKIQNRYQTDDSPSEILRGLQDRLSSLLDKESGLGLAYAVIDAADGRLRYARTGSHPAIYVGRKGGQTNKDFHLAAAKEQEIRFASHYTVETELTIVEGAAKLDAGDSVVLFTDGLAKDWQQNKGTPEREFASVLKEASGKSSDELQQKLTDKVSACAKRARKQGLEDDLTAVIVRLDNNEAGEEMGAGALAELRSAE